MKGCIAVLVLIFGMSTYAVDKGEVKGMLEQFKNSGMFTEEQLKAAQKQLEGMSQEDLDALEGKAKEKLSDPEIQNKIKQLND